jgi:hypothetical protein
MTTAAIFAHREENRIQRLHSHGILDTEPEEFDENPRATKATPRNTRFKS